MSNSPRPHYSCSSPKFTSISPPTPPLFLSFLLFFSSSSSFSPSYFCSPPPAPPPPSPAPPLLNSIRLNLCYPYVNGYRSLCYGMGNLLWIALPKKTNSLLQHLSIVIKSSARVGPCKPSLKDVEN